MRRKGGAKVAVEAGQGGLGAGGLDVEDVEEGGEEELELGLGKAVAEAHALASTKGQKVARLDAAPGGRLQKALRPECFRLLPQVGRHVEGV